MASFAWRCCCLNLTQINYAKRLLHILTKIVDDISLTRLVSLHQYNCASRLDSVADFAVLSFRPTLHKTYSFFSPSKLATKQPFRKRQIVQQLSWRRSRGWALVLTRSWRVYTENFIKRMQILMTCIPAKLLWITQGFYPKLLRLRYVSQCTKPWVIGCLRSSIFLYHTQLLSVSLFWLHLLTCMQTESSLYVQAAVVSSTSSSICP